MVSHSNVGRDNIHEPKGVENASEGAVYRADGGGSGNWSELNEGWAFYADNTYLTGSRQSITGSTRTQVTIDGLGSTTETSYLLGGDVWDTTNDRITPQEVGKTYDLRFAFKGQTATANTYVDVELDIGSGASIIIAQQTFNFTKGTGTQNSFVFSVPIFCLSTFIANGGKLYLTPNNDADFWDYSILLVSTTVPVSA